MNSTRFANVVIIGQAKIAVEILKYVLAMQNEYSYECSCVIYENPESNALFNQAKKDNVEAYIKNKEDLKQFWTERYKDRTLIISAFNNYLFPASLINNSIFTIINYHNSYLPAYQGGNAITRAIFNKDAFAGSTWHYVTAKVDCGDIIWQGKFPIAEDAKAYEVSRDSMDCAFKGFKQFFTSLLKDEIVGSVQTYDNGIRDMWLFSKFPNDGKVFENDSPETAYRLLRSMDYGKGSGWRLPKLVLNNGEEHNITAYRLINTDKNKDRFFDTDNGAYYIKYPGKGYLKMKLEKSHE